MRAWFAAAAVILAGACAAAPDRTSDAASAPPTPVPEPGSLQTGAGPASPFVEPPGWATLDHAAARRTFLATCPRIAARGPDWTQACAILAGPEAALAPRSAFEAAFQTRDLTPNGPGGRVTAYYEPIITARRSPLPPYDAPLHARPADLAELTVPSEGGARREVVKQGPDGVYYLYDHRGEIARRIDTPAIAWTRLSDKIFLQIQGSGRLAFPDGQQVRAAFDGHNGATYASIARALVAAGELPQGRASNAAIKAWLDRADPARARAIVDQNPRYVFFKATPLGDPTLGPPGAAQVPLSSASSIAVDPSHHPLGAVFVVAPVGVGAPASRLAVAQDTGGAILGPLRADFYFGTGPEVGDRAARISHQARWWALEPRPSRP